MLEKFSTVQSPLGNDPCTASQPWESADAGGHPTPW